MRARLISLVLILMGQIGYAQTSHEGSPSKNWFNEGPEKHKVIGVSTADAYQFVHDKKSKTVVVAVIDSGIDINHEDLSEVIWSNPNEIAGNGIDDDKNGYVDDVHGWNFIGGKNGENVNAANFEVTREYRKLKSLYENSTPTKKSEVAYWEEIEGGYLTGVEDATQKHEFYSQILNTFIRFNKLLTAYLDVEELSLELLQTINSPDKQITQGVNFMSNLIGMYEGYQASNIIAELGEATKQFEDQVKFNYSLDFNPRSVVGDDVNNLTEIGYGNNDVIGIGTDNFHGTHVAGIIAAKRDNNIGIDGIADNVKIMALRAVPNGDEQDKDVANAIRYAVDNGAQIINMSFGKAYSPSKKYVDEAVKYAEDNNVLLIHAAGNEGVNTDEKNNFPNRTLGKKEVAKNWLEVGASGWGNDDQLAASFSNYGKKSVDLFAPGVQIYSTAPGNEYKDAQGTSMASPVTAGVAALVLSYYPHLSATDLKEILMQSTRKFNGLMVTQPGSDGELVDFSELSVSGGVVDAFEAVKLADSRKLSSK